MQEDEIISGSGATEGGSGPGRLNPWFSIWLKPRETIRQVVDADPGRWVLPLAIGGGAAGGLMRGFQQNPEALAVPKGFLLLVSAFLGAAIGLLGLFFCGWLFRWVGSRLGGQANSTEVRAAIAYREIPNLWLFGLSCLVMLSAAAGGPLLSSILGLLFIVVAMVVSVWGLVIMSRMLGEVHRFSARKGFYTLLLSYSPLLLVVIVAMVAAIAVPNFQRAKARAQERAAAIQMQNVVR